MNENKQDNQLNPSPQDNASNDKMLQETQKALDTLTPRNWAFINYLRKNVPIKEAYKLAGYTSKVPSAPYVLHAHLKSKMELVEEIEGFNRFKYMQKLHKLVDLPLAESKKDVSISEALRVLKLFKSSLPEMNNAPTQQFTQIIIKRCEAPKRIVDVVEVDAQDADIEK